MFYAPPVARLQTRLVQALVIPAGLGLVAIAVYADQSARGRLEDALAQRLTTVAGLVSQATNPRIALLEAGDEGTRTHQRTSTALQDAAKRANVDRIVVAHFDGHRALVDSAQRTPIGQAYGRARFDRIELERVAGGVPAASLLFQGPDGRPYKTGYAPFSDRDGRGIGFVAVEAAADYADALLGLRLRLALGTVVALVGLVLAAIYAARTVSTPLAQLSDAAAQIGRGELDTPIPGHGPTEAQILAETMRAMAASLKARDEELQLMLAGIAHEVRNPLGGIELFGGLLREDLTGDPRAKHVDKILKELATLSTVVNDFLHYARRTEPEPKPFSAYDLLFDVASVAEKSASDRDVRLRVEASKDLEVEVDVESMKRALLNLVVNAVQASPLGQTVELRAAIEGPEAVTLAVSDHGPGVAPDRRAQIFQPFFTTKQKGTGLGLALVHKTVMQHHGAIHVEDVAGGGARFVVTLRR